MCPMGNFEENLEEVEREPHVPCVSTVVAVIVGCVADGRIAFVGQVVIVIRVSTAKIGVSREHSLT